MLTVGDQIPKFELQGVKKNQIRQYSDIDLKGKWTILFFYPEDFSFICPTEVTGFNEKMRIIEDLDAQIFGVSVDSIDLHAEWIRELNIEYPLLSDIGGKLSEKFGVLDEKDNRAQRATFIVDPSLKIEFVMVTSRNVGRSVLETIRILAAIRSGDLCPADYNSLEEKT